ncbi:MAG: hypothetical protein JWM55_2167 [Acidimicrobiaceae bacterium]|nr:hypothetical protein [Acidimicrobiaceae bacterium]
MALPHEAFHGVLDVVRNAVSGSRATCSYTRLASLFDSVDRRFEKKMAAVAEGALAFAISSFSMEDWPQFSALKALGVGL